MTRRFRHWLRRYVFGRAADLPVFYAVVTIAPGPLLVTHETTRSVHRARGVARELRARYEQTGVREKVGVATYYAEAVTEDF